MLHNDFFQMGNKVFYVIQVVLELAVIPLPKPSRAEISATYRWPKFFTACKSGALTSPATQGAPKAHT